MTKNNMSFVSLQLDGTTDYAAELEEINFYEFETITMNLEADNNQTVELPFDEFSIAMHSDAKEKFNVTIENAMGDNKYSVDYLNSLNLNDCKKAEIVFHNADGEQIKIDLGVDYINVEAQIPVDEFGELMVKIADEDDEIFKALVDK